MRIQQMKKSGGSVYKLFSVRWESSMQRDFCSFLTKVTEITQKSGISGWIK